MASIWTQWGASIVEQYPQEEWAEQVRKIPESYRGDVLSMMIRQHGMRVEA
jgi:hypothetical protein